METTLEEVLITQYKDEMIAYLAHHPEDFDQAVELALGNKQPFSWRAAWLLWSCMEKNDLRLQGSIGKIIHALPGKNDGHQRELLKILLFLDIPEKYEGVLFDLAAGLWEKIHLRPSVRVMAFRMIMKIAQKHPDLKQELKFLLQEQYLETLSPGIKRSVERMLQESGF